MKAKIISLNLSATGRSGNGKTYTFAELVTQGLPWKGKEASPRTHRIFTNSPVYPSLKGLEVGDFVEYGVDDSQYKNMNSIVRIEAPQEQAPAAKSSSKGYNDDETQLRIARSVALKAATDLCNGMMEHGTHFKKTTKPEIMVEEILTISRGFEHYLTLQEDTAALASDVSSLDTGDSSDFDDQIPFD